MKDVYRASLLYMNAYRILRQDFMDMLKPFDISILEWSVLSIVNAKTGESFSQIAHVLGVDPSMITQLLPSLIQKQYVEIHSDLQDRRMKFLFLTQSGDEFEKTIEKDMTKKLNVYFKSVSLDDISAHLRVLEEIVKHAS